MKCMRDEVLLLCVCAAVGAGCYLTRRKQSRALLQTSPNGSVHLPEKVPADDPLEASKGAVLRLKKADKKQAKKARKKALKEERARIVAAKQEASRLQKKKEKEKSAKSVPIPAGLLDPTDGADKDVNITPAVEVEHVIRVYDTIADQWDGTRYKPWPKVAQFINAQPPHSIFADVGCGNGKNLPTCNTVGFGMGSDISAGLAKIVAERGQEVLVADIMKLPYRTCCADAVLCIAVLHHISTKPRRIQALRECMRVLRVQGQALFYAWAQEQSDESRSGHQFADQDVFVPWHLKTKGGNSCEGTEKQGQLVEQATHGQRDEEKSAVVFQRYCHVYRKGEIEALFQDSALVGWTSVVNVYYDTGNWALVVKKTAETPASDSDSSRQHV